MPSFRNGSAASEGSIASRETIGAGDGIRTRDQELGKLLLYQLSYARLMPQTLAFSDRYDKKRWSTNADRF